MAVKITPLQDRVLVRRLEEKESVKSGIIIPDTAKEKPQEGEVIAVGSGRREKGKLIPLDVKPGDRVLFGKYGGNDIKIDDEEYMILKEDEILAKIGGLAKAAAGGRRELPESYKSGAGTNVLKNPSGEEKDGKANHHWREFAPVNPTRLQYTRGRRQNHARPEGA